MVGTKNLILNSEGSLIAEVYVMRSARCGTAWAKVQEIQSSGRRVILEMKYPGGSFRKEAVGNFVYTAMARVAPGDCVEGIATVFFNDQVGHWDPTSVSSCR